MKKPVEWRHVLPLLPQPREAHNAEMGARRVEIRLTYIPAAEKPYVLVVRYIDTLVLVKEYTADYPKMIGRARSAYKAAQRAAESWLQGGPLR